MKYPDARPDVFNIASGGYAGYTGWAAVQTQINNGVKLKDVAAIVDPTGLVLSYRIIKTAIELGYVTKAEWYNGVKYPL